MNPKNPLFKQNRKDWNVYGDIIKFGETIHDDKREKHIPRFKYAMWIVRIFLELVINDLIHNNTTFHFPMSNTIKIRIAEKPNISDYHIKQFGKKYSPWLLFGLNFSKRAFGFYYYLIFSKKINDVLSKEVLNGHTYRVGINGEQQMKKIKRYDKFEVMSSEENKDVSNYI